MPRHLRIRQISEGSSNDVAIVCLPQDNPVDNKDQPSPHTHQEFSGAVGGENSENTTNPPSSSSVDDHNKPPTLLQIGKEGDPRRHCAFCLNPIPSLKVLLCGGCQRRAYCSKMCQISDWDAEQQSTTDDSSTSTTESSSSSELTTAAGTGNIKIRRNPPKGQIHKNWCGVEYGEEDLDWKVAAVGDGRGLGIVALRPFPKNSRIMVDPCQSRDGIALHPKTRQLLPNGGTFTEKFRLNGIPCDLYGQVLCLRIARVNHKCVPNAGHFLAKNTVKVLYSEKDIAAGEEIFINYSDLYRVPNKEYKAILKIQWGIECPFDCVCKNRQKIAILAKIQDLDKQVGAATHCGYLDLALKYAQDILGLHEEFDSPWNQVDRTLYDLFQISLMSQVSLPWARLYITKLYNLVKDMLHPQATKLRVYDRWRKDFTKHRNYLALDKGPSSPKFKGYEVGSPEYDFETHATIINAFHNLQLVQLAGYE